MGSAKRACSSLEDAQQKIFNNRRKVAEDRWQQELVVVDRKLTLLLLKKIDEIASNMSDPKGSYFIDKIKSIAQLSDDDMQQFNKRGNAQYSW